MKLVYFINCGLFITSVKQTHIAMNMQHEIFADIKLKGLDVSKCIVSVLSIKQCIGMVLFLTAKCAIMFVYRNVDKKVKCFKNTNGIYKKIYTIYH